MKNKILVALFSIGISTITIALFPSCNNSTEPKESQRLIIENGFYSKVEIVDSNDIKYAIEFTCYVKAEKCNWGGYAIQMDSHGGSLHLYRMLTLNPEERYQRVDTFKVSSVLENNPIIKMEGYRIGSSETYNELYAEYVLQPK